MTSVAEAVAFPDIVGSVDRVMADKIKVYPCHSNRASAIGDDCERRLVYERTSWRLKQKHDVGLEYIFMVGNLLEKPVLDMLHGAGYQAIRQQEPFEYKSGGELLCTGHIDAILVGEDGRQFVAEIKSMNPHIWDSVNTAEDMKKYPWTRKYAWQLHLYMFGLEIPQAVWILVNKSTGRIKQINATLDMEICEAALRRCESVNAHVKAGTLPDQLVPTPENADICTKCPFFALCAPAVNYGELKLIVDDVLVSDIDEMQYLEEPARRYGKIKDALKKKFEATGTMRAAIGKWLYDGTKRIWTDRWTRLGDAAGRDQV